MFALVLLCNGFKKSLWYRVPENLSVAIGSLVKVPLKNQKLSAIIIQLTIHQPDHHGTTRDIINIEKTPDDHLYIKFIGSIAHTYQCNPLFFIKRLQTFLHDSKKETIDNTYHDQKSVQMPLLTTEQTEVINFVQSYIHKKEYSSTLLHGITGSGKTEVYKACINYTLNLGKTVLFLLPEVTLAIEFEERLKKELGYDHNIFGFHSGKTVTQKKLLWQKLLENMPVLIIGVHLPVFLPIFNLGLIIVDEEHDHGFQEKNHPKINSKYAALIKAQLYNIPILLGSATPSIRSLHMVKKGLWKFFQLNERFGGSLATIEIAALKDKNKKRIQFWVTKKLETAITSCLEKKEQVILFLNRRGMSFFVQCSGCATVFKCHNCSVSLTLHEKNILQCHYCGHTKKMAPACPHCHTDEKDFLKKGIGTQQMVKIIKELFPQARVGRADMDVTKNKKEWHTTIAAFKKRDIDILIGTQTITKGYHFPHVTLVGLIWADLSLNFPLFNATEHSLQQIIQVAGRAGRSCTHGQVIIQMMDEHPITHFFDEKKYLNFYSQEIISRTTVGYPPEIELVEIELQSYDEDIIERESMAFTQHMYALAQQNKIPITILGPTKPMIHKIKKIEIRTIFIKAHTIETIISMYKQISRNNYASSFFFNPIF